jgi:transposase
MHRIPRAVFTKEFKDEAVKMVIEGGLSQPEVCRRLSIGDSTLSRWVKQAKNGINPIRRNTITEEEWKYPA